MTTKTKASGRRSRDNKSRRGDDRNRNNPWVDMLALAIIVGAAVTLVVVGHATAAVLAAAGGFAVGLYRGWRMSQRR
ncbi:hypothetical protein ACFQZZ_08730 [Nocardia sp. GCM10030253]|uniref:hypothetical protein n=1 Tax=Nocardia sp. GCM10030253 TaxID=3273404 RepID=UPI003626D5D7